MVPDINRLMAGADAALVSTFAERCMLLGSPWYVYYAPASRGIIVDRSDNPESPIPDDWRMVVRLSPDWTRHKALRVIREHLEHMHFPTTPEEG